MGFFGMNNAKKEKIERNEIQCMYLSIYYLTYAILSNKISTQQKTPHK